MKKTFERFFFFSNGGAACSIFCMCVMLLDQLKNEHAVDIFQRVRTLQRQRIAMITSLVGRIFGTKLDYFSSRSFFFP